MCYREAQLSRVLSPTFPVFPKAYLSAGDVVPIMAGSVLAREERLSVAMGNRVRPVAVRKAFRKIYGFLPRGMPSQMHSLLRIGVECLINLAKVCESYEFVEAFGIVAEQ